jgi:hypothetical protein
MAAAAADRRCQRTRRYPARQGGKVSDSRAGRSWGVQAGADSRLKETVVAPAVVYAGWAFRKLMLPLRRGAAATFRLAARPSTSRR